MAVRARGLWDGGSLSYLSANVSCGPQVIVFSFSKKECEALALQMAPLDLNDESEHKLVEGVFWNAVDSLSEDDRRLPQACPCLQSRHNLLSWKKPRPCRPVMYICPL